MLVRSYVRSRRTPYSYMHARMRRRGVGSIAYLAVPGGSGARGQRRTSANQVLAVRDRLPGPDRSSILRAHDEEGFAMLVRSLLAPSPLAPCVPRSAREIVPLRLSFRSAADGPMIGGTADGTNNFLRLDRCRQQVDGSTSYSTYTAQAQERPAHRTAAHGVAYPRCWSEVLVRGVG